MKNNNGVLNNNQRIHLKPFVLKKDEKAIKGYVDKLPKQGINDALKLCRD
jgi:hypothetical protein